MSRSNWMISTLSSYEDNDDAIYKAASVTECDSDEETVATVFQKSSWKSVETSSQEELSPKPRKTRFSWWTLNDEEPSHAIKKKSSNKKKSKSKESKANTRHSSPVTSTEHEEAMKRIKKSLDKKKTKKKKSKKTKTDKKKSSKTKRKQSKEVKEEASPSSSKSETDSTTKTPPPLTPPPPPCVESMEQEPAALSFDAAQAFKINVRKLQILQVLQKRFERHQDELVSCTTEQSPRPVQLEILFGAAAAPNKDEYKYEEETIIQEEEEEEETVVCQYYEKEVSMTRRQSL